MDNTNNPKNNAELRPQSAMRPTVKTIFLDADTENAGRLNLLLCALLLFFCVFAVCAGLILCVSGSFKLEIDFFNVILALLASLLFFTVIYFLPSRIFTLLAFLSASGAAALWVLYNFERVKDSLYYTLNLCLYRISQEGYLMGNIIDYDLAKTNNAATAGFVQTSAVLAVIFFAAVFSFLLYSKKNIIYSILISIAVVFPGFFYGLIPSYFAFSLVAAFWVSQFAINMFESGYIEYIIGKENTVPEKKLTERKFKAFKKQYKKEVKSLKKEIIKIVNSPNRNENLIQLDRLIRRLESISKNNRLLFIFYGLNNLRLTKKNKRRKKGKKSANQTKTKFMTPVQIEKLRLKTDAKEKKAAAKANTRSEKKEFSGKPFSEKMKIRFSHNINLKKKYSLKSGYAGFFAFIVAFATVTVVQPFIAPDAKLDLSMPEAAMQFLTSTVEYTLVGSDSSVYGGYAGGMGGGFLYRPEGARFRDKPILKITAAKNSAAVYLKGWTGTIYTGTMWREADKKHIEAYNKLKQASPLPRFNFISEIRYFSTFTETMQNVFDVSYMRRDFELRPDSINIEHLVSGGRRSFMPYFLESYKTDSAVGFRTTADLSIEVTNSFFRYPAYTANFYTVDNVLNRAVPHAVGDLKEYLDFYYSKADVSAPVPEFFSLMDPPALTAVMPEARFYSERGFFNIGNRTFDRLNEEGTFYEYSAPSIEYADELDYHGYIYIPYKYDEIIDIIKVRYNIYIKDGAGLGYINPDYVSSEVMYNKFARDYYLDVPPDFPLEVIDLALEITEGLKSDYEKALAVEKYIAENYTYTLSPAIPDNPKGDFVYNFLFDVKEGYCTAYASAMVMMMRALGVPARYSEGYLVDATKRQKDEDGNEFIIVYDYDGHAWPEVYLRGIGWLPFEPTVSYTEEAETAAPPYVYTPPPRIPELGSPYMPLPEEEEEEDDLGAGTKKRGLILPAPMLALIAVILACGAVYVINRIVVSKRFKYFRTANANAAVLKMLAYVLGFLRRCGFMMHNDEGLREFAKRVSPGFETITPEGWDEIAVIMQKARYSAHAIPEHERDSVFEFIESLRKECLKRLRFNMKFKLRYLYFII